MQEPDWNSVFAPTARYTILIVLIALACHHDLEIEPMDVITTFLNPDVESQVYMYQPAGYKVLSNDGIRLACHLREALYRIWEAPMAWNALFTSWLVSYGLEQSLVDPRVFTTWIGILLYILAVYVDDRILVEKHGGFIVRFKSDLSSKFKIEELGPASWLLACIIERDRDQ